MENIKLTQYSHGAGCGCKISPQILSKILHSNEAFPDFDKLIVGNNSRDDAAVLDIGNGRALISTTDFFMPIVDDAYDFGRIASANAISDVYAMGGTPVLAIAILGWPIDKLAPEIARRVIEGSRSMCMEAGIPLAGGHSIDSPEPIFGLAVNGLVDKRNIKTNSSGQEGNLLFLTKPLGIGILTTAEKKGLLQEEHKGLATEYMTRLNRIGEALGKVESVRAMTDVTGFGLLGHLIEMCEGSKLVADINTAAIPIFPELDFYIDNKCIPGGTTRNFASYGDKVATLSDRQKAILCDPQTSGGLLVALDQNDEQKVRSIFREHGLEEFFRPIGSLKANGNSKLVVNVFE